MKLTSLQEALLNVKKAAHGTVPFSKSSFTDPHIQKVMAAIAVEKGQTVQEIIDQLTPKVQKIQDRAKIAPKLYGTVAQNAVENELFSIFWKDCKIQTNAPRFQRRMFFKMMRATVGEVEEFWPLKNFIDKRRLEPDWGFTAGEQPDHGITTAAAFPSGKFVFNEDFMQKLMDYSHLKGVKPKGKKFVSNGGDIPDEYAYIEFVLMHELMHYSYADFHYQKIIPNAINKVINFVGDFRTNYLLVKSGYEQLPMGLFSDDINYDRYKEYIDMYNAVLEEMKKFPPEDEDDGLQETDNHEPGQEEGEKEPTEGKSEKDIDDAADKITKEMDSRKDQAPKEREKKEGEGTMPGQGDSSGTPGSGGSGWNEVDYDKIEPAFSWQGIIKRFVATATNRSEETYSKPARRSAASVDILAQTGAAAVKPSEKPQEFADTKLFFCFDSSGSMTSIIPKIFATAVNLLKSPAFRASECLVLNYSDSHKLYRVNFAKDKAAHVPDIRTKAKSYPLRFADVMKGQYGGTRFSQAQAAEMIQAAKSKWNIMIFIDSDNLSGENWKNLASVIRSAPRNVFVIFDSRATYIQFRQLNGGATANITYFK